MFKFKDRIFFKFYLLIKCILSEKEEEQEGRKDTHVDVLDAEADEEANAEADVEAGAEAYNIHQAGQAG